MTPFNNTPEVRRFWRNLRSRYRTYVRRMKANEAAGRTSRKPYLNIIPFSVWLMGKTVEDTFLQQDFGGHTPPVVQEMADRALPTSEGLWHRGINPDRFYSELAAYASKRLGFEVELVDTTTYASDGQHAKPSKRFAKKR